MPFKKQLLVAVISAVSTSMVLAQEEQTQQNSTDLETVVVKGEREKGFLVEQMNTATKLDLSIRQTPQSISVINEQLIDDFQLNTVNDALALTTGIQIEKPETDRVYYTSRGFEITNFQLDGVGMPLSNNNVLGDIDTAMFERIEILRGANGLTAGKGDPSATINMIRKRPTVDTQGSVALTAGSWNKVRLDTDLSGALSEKLRGRVVAAKETSESYLDRYEKDLTLGYGVLEADLGSGTNLTLGFSQQESNTDAPLWGALPLVYSDGSATNYDRSTSTAADWTFFDNKEQRAFVELNKSFANGWRAVASYNHALLDTHSNLFYVAGTPNLDETGVVGAYSSEYNVDEEHSVAEVFAAGPVSLLGRVHEIVLGANYSEASVEQESVYDATTVAGFSDPSQLTPINVAEFNGNYPKPVFTIPGGGGKFDDTASAIYSTAKLNLSEQDIVVIGGRYSEWKTSGVAYGATKEAKDTVFIPYLGYVRDLNDYVSAYVSYTETFVPQTEYDTNLERLDARTGVNYELGVKADVYNANVTLAAFKTKLENVATPAGEIQGTQVYEGRDGIESQGIEAEVIGELAEGFNMAAGFTVLSIKDADGNDTNLYAPTETANLALSYSLPTLSQLTLGVVYDWQNEIEGVVKQEAYGLTSLTANYAVTPSLKANVKINNVGDEKYINSLKWDQGYYGAPRNFSASVEYAF
ncbi:TonB-dependent siderophore receptor [Bermanella sp. R86510]|uniref:TonB-dependent siderophore receptor n=1 Tax=unclassified Bermanella TaxID=2627862 RepID=UPI0037C8FDA6